MVDHMDRRRVAEGVDEQGVGRDGGGVASGGVGNRCGGDVASEASAAATIVMAVTALG
jgi:hypothetical protein